MGCSGIALHKVLVGKASAWEESGRCSSTHRTVALAFLESCPAWLSCSMYCRASFCRWDRPVKIAERTARPTSGPGDSASVGSWAHREETPSAVFAVLNLGGVVGDAKCPRHGPWCRGSLRVAGCVPLSRRRSRFRTLFDPTALLEDRSYPEAKPPREQRPSGWGRGSGLDQGWGRVGPRRWRHRSRMGNSSVNNQWQQPANPTQEQAPREVESAAHPKREPGQWKDIPERCPSWFLQLEPGFGLGALLAGPLQPQLPGRPGHTHPPAPHAWRLAPDTSRSTLLRG